MTGHPRARLTVFGSLVVDLVARAPRRPRPGETLRGSSFGIYPGGKGLNQAIAASRLGAEVRLVGAVGGDSHGDLLVRTARDEGIDVSGVVRVQEATAVGHILVTEGGDVSIVGIPGANDLVDPSSADRSAAILESSDICLVQCEVPSAASRRALEIAEGAVGILNAAPSGERARDLLGHVGVAILNEPELEDLGELDEGAIDDLARVTAAAGSLGTEIAVVTLSNRGAIAVAGEEVWAVDAHPVDAVDATGAGDAFVAAFALEWHQTGDIEESLTFANAAGAVAVRVSGAAPSMPRREEVISLLDAAGAPRVRRL